MPNEKLRLLLIENAPADAELCLATLRKGGLEVESDLVQCEGEFRAKAEAERYDVILADYNLPGWNGMEAFEYLHGKGQDIPFILVSGALGDETAVECIKRGVSDYVLKDRLARLPIAIRQALEEKNLLAQRKQAEVEIRRLNESLERQVAERTAQLEAANKELEAENGERRRAEKIMRKSQERFRLLMDGVKDYAIFMLNSEGRVASWNRGAERVQGYRTEEILGRHLSHFYPGEEVEQGSPLQDLRTAATEGRLELEGWRVRNDGSRFRANMVLTPLHDSTGRLKGFSVVVRDVTEWRRAQDALDQLRQQQALILNSAGEGICGLDGSGKCTFINPAGAAMLGWEPADLECKFLYQFLRHTPSSEPSPSAVEGRIQTALKNGEALHEDNGLLWRRDGTSFAADYIITPMHNDQGEMLGAVVVLRDITQRRAMERMKDEFLSVVSHELRTPLTAIRATFGLLATGKLCQAPQGCQKLVATGMTNADRLVRLVNDILDLERMESDEARMEYKVCDSEALLVQAADLMRVTAESQGVAMTVQPLAATFWADPDRIMQVLINLLGNAIKFSPPGAEISLSAEQAGGEIIFQVKDQGRGIPAHKASLIFERFRQVDASDAREKGGTGLGLAICRSIVAQHGGRIWMESAPGCGSTFFFAIPVDQVVHSRAGKKSVECRGRS